jgi:hypothetical protein
MRGASPFLPSSAAAQEEKPNARPRAAPAPRPRRGRRRGGGRRRRAAGGEGGALEPHRRVGALDHQLLRALHVGGVTCAPRNATAGVVVGLDVSGLNLSDTMRPALSRLRGL